MRWVIGVLAVLILAIGGIFGWFRYVELPKSLPSTKGVLTLPQLEKPVDVYTDPYGVPHIYAENEDDLFFATGYVQASERLYKMDMMARAVEGRFAEVLGEDFVDTDKYLRTWGFFRIAKDISMELDDETFHLLQRAVDGINAYIENQQDHLPVEFRIAGYDPLRWRVEHIIGYARLMANDLTLAWMPEIFFAAVLDELGEDYAMELYPVYPDTKPFIVPRRMEGLSQALKPVLQSQRELRALTGARGTMVGSNNWVLSGSKTVSGKPLLANDPHLGFTQPAVWYEMHLVGGRFDVAGVTLAGIPLVIIGQNRSIAWGFTNVMADDMDFYVEQVDPHDSTRVLVGDRYEPMQVHHEQIQVKSGDPVDFLVRETRHGPIINGVHSTLQAHPQQALAMSWTGSQITTEVQALFQLNMAEDWEDFSEAASLFKVPGQNMIYADTAGNIGWRPAVMIPRRAPGTGLVPMPGEDPSWDWKGFVPADELPSRYNPAEGFIATANNKTIGDEFPYYISAYWAPPSRIARISEILSQDRKFDVGDMASLQVDVLSDHARDFIPLVLRYARPAPTELSPLLDILESWDYRNHRESTSATVFNIFFMKLVHQVYGDEIERLGPAYEEAFLDQGSIPIRNLQFLFEQGRSLWFDDLRTGDVVEGPREDILAALTAAQEELEDRFGKDPTSWCWGRIHTLTHPHPLASIPVLDKLLGLSVGPFEMPGSNTTVLNMEFEMADPFKITLGPSMRHIHDFSEFYTGTRSILPTGQSGNPVSPHYADQAVLYNTGGYRVFPTDMHMILSLGYDHLIMTP